MYKVTSTTAAFIDGIKKLNALTDEIMQAWNGEYAESKEDEIMQAHEVYQNMILKLMNTHILSNIAEHDAEKTI